MEKTTNQPDWNKLEADVLMSLRCLRVAWEHTDGQPIHEAMARDLYVPCLRLLAEFCACVDAILCSDCPPVGYPTDRTRCEECPRRGGAA